MLLTNLEQVLGSLLAAKQQSHKHLRIATGCLAFLLVLLVLLTPKFGIMGVLFARIVASIVVIMMLEKKTGQRVVSGVNGKRLVYWIFSAVVMYFLVMNILSQQILEMRWGGALLLILTGSLLYSVLNISYISRVVLPFLFRNYAA